VTLETIYGRTIFDRDRNEIPCCKRAVPEGAPTNISRHISYTYHDMEFFVQINRTITTFCNLKQDSTNYVTSYTGRHKMLTQYFNSV